MKFSKSKFIKSAPKNIVKALKPYLDDLNGETVNFEEKYGEVNLEYEQETTCVYPILKEWCDE